MNKTGVILLSGGLDSLVSLVVAKELCNVELAITFDYSQRALKEEVEAASKIASFYNIKHRVVELPFLSEITNNALVNGNANLNFKELDEKSAKAVWVPNRNGLFLNIAASFADAKKYDYIIIGANKEEAGTFPDNSVEFLQRANDFFGFSTLVQPKILAPLKCLEKYEIVNLAIKKNAPLEFLKSCYNSTEICGKKHCGECESCKRLKAAILKSVNKDLLKLFF